MAKGVAVDAAIFGDRTHIFGAYDDDDASGTPTNESIESIDYDMAAESQTFATNASSAANAQTHITHPLPTPNANSPTGIQSGGAPGLQGPNDMDSSGATSITLNHDARGAHGISEAMVTNTTTTSNGPPYNADVPTNTDTSKLTEDNMEVENAENSSTTGARIRDRIDQIETGHKGKASGKGVSGKGVLGKAAPGVLRTTPPTAATQRDRRLPRETPYSSTRQSEGTDEATAEETVTTRIQGLRISDNRQDQDIDAAFQSYFEASVMEHAELIQGVRATSDPTRTPQLPKRSELRHWSSVNDALKLLAFAPDSTDDWRFLGISHAEGPPLTAELIERRAQLGRQLVSVRHTAAWTCADIASAVTFEERLKRVVESCTKELPRLQRERKKLPSRLVPRWLEPSAELLHLVHSRAQDAGQAHKIALHLSNVQKTTLQDYAQIVSPLAARVMYEKIHKSPLECEEIFRSLGNGSLTIWAPTERAALLRLAATFQKYAASPEAMGSIQLLIPHDHYPECTAPMQILDLWGHELLGQKWRNIVQRIEFLREPTRCVFSGEVCPLHRIRSIAIVTLSTNSSTFNSVSTQWRTQLDSKREGPAIIVDVACAQELATQRALNESDLRGLLVWSGPLRSLGSVSDNQRSSFVGHFDGSIVSDLDVQLYMKMLRQSPTLQGALIGSRGLFTSEAALLADFGNVRSISEETHFLDEVVLVSPRLALLTTPHDSRYWGGTLTRQLRSDPTSAIKGIRYRPSKGGRPWAKPAALPIQIQNARAQAALRNAHTTATMEHQHRCAISITEIPTGMPDDLLQVIVQHVSDILGLPLQRNDDLNAMRVYDWQPLQDPLGRWRGGLVVQCSNQQETRTLHDRLQGNCIERNGTPCILEVNNPHARPHLTPDPPGPVMQTLEHHATVIGTNASPLGPATGTEGVG